jgi:tricarballylate dehydrogenase
MAIFSDKAGVMDPSRVHDVVVVGGGNAGLCAAISARQCGASALLLEQAPRDLRGGNSRHGRNLRVMHDAPGAFLHGVYGEDDYWRDLAEVCGPEVEESLARMAIRESAGAVDWMAARGVQFQASGNGRIGFSRKTAYLVGGGKAVLNAYYRTAARLGVEILYDAEVLALPLEGGGVREIAVSLQGSRKIFRAKKVVVAAGGHQANIGWLKREWGEAAENFMIRGSAIGQGGILAALLDQRAAPVGDPAQCHMVAVDARGPKFDGGIVTRLDCAPYSLVVDRNGRRFHDEGAETGPKRYAIWGALLAQCPGQIAYAVFDDRAEPFFPPRFFRRFRPEPSPNWRKNWGSIRRRWPRPSMTIMRRCAPDPMAPPRRDAPKASRRRKPAGRFPSKPRPSALFRCGPASPSAISASRSTPARAWFWRTGASPPTCSRRARSWRPISWGAAISPAWD